MQQGSTEIGRDIPTAVEQTRTKIWTRTWTHTCAHTHVFQIPDWKFTRCSNWDSFVHNLNNFKIKSNNFSLKKIQRHPRKVPQTESHATNIHMQTNRLCIRTNGASAKSSDKTRPPLIWGWQLRMGQSARMRTWPSRRIKANGKECTQGQTWKDTEIQGEKVAGEWRIKLTF